MVIEPICAAAKKFPKDICSQHFEPHQPLLRCRSLCLTASLHLVTGPAAGLIEKIRWSSFQRASVI